MGLFDFLDEVQVEDDILVGERGGEDADADFLMDFSLEGARIFTFWRGCEECALQMPESSEKGPGRGATGAGRKKIVTDLPLLLLTLRARPGSLGRHYHADMRRDEDLHEREGGEA